MKKDIVVHVPDADLMHVLKDKANPKNLAWWTVPFRPKSEIGRIFFESQGWAFGFAEVDGVEFDEAGGWFHINWLGENFRGLLANAPRVECPSRGFRYLEDGEGDELLRSFYGDRRTPRPGIDPIPLSMERAWELVKLERQKQLGLNWPDHERKQHDWIATLVQELGALAWQPDRKKFAMALVKVTAVGLAAIQWMWPQGDEEDES